MNTVTKSTLEVFLFETHFNGELRSSLGKVEKIILRFKEGLVPISALSCYFEVEGIDQKVSIGDIALALSIPPNALRPVFMGIHLEERKGLLGASFFGMNPLRYRRVVYAPPEKTDLHFSELGTIAVSEENMRTLARVLRKTIQVTITDPLGTERSFVVS
jgi:hypothetical protein